MTDPLSRIATRFAYGATQLPRVAWYVGHGLAMRRLAKAARPQHGKAVGSARIPMPLCLIADAFMPIWLFSSGRTSPT
jgi:hypothetical protein